MDTEKCAALLTALQVGNLSGAAAQLGYTPSGMSRMMTALESELGFPLLFRSKAGVVPTPECERMLPVLTDLAALGRTCRQTAAHIRGLDVGAVRVGSAYRQFYGILAQILAAFTAQHPGIQVDIRMENSSPLLALLESHQVDLCIASKRTGRFAWTPLLADPMVAVTPRNHPLAQSGTPYPLARFAADPFIQISAGPDSDNDRTLAAAHVAPHPRFTVFDNRAAAELVAAGLGVTLMNRLCAHEYRSTVAVLPLDTAAPVQIGIAQDADATPSPAVEAFRTFAAPRLAAYAAQTAQDAYNPKPRLCRSPRLGSSGLAAAARRPQRHGGRPCVPAARLPSSPSAGAPTGRPQSWPHR